MIRKPLFSIGLSSQPPDQTTLWMARDLLPIYLRHLSAPYLATYCEGHAVTTLVEVVVDRAARMSMVSSV